MFLYKHALVSIHLFFSHLYILLDERFSQERKFTKLLLANNTVVVSSTDPFHIYNIEYKNVQNEESSGS